MSLNNKSFYIAGLTNMASFNIGCSYMKSYCYELNNYIDEFAKDYRVPKDIIKLEEEKENIEPFFKEVLNLDKKQAETFTFWLQKQAGKCNKIYTPKDNKLCDKLGGENNGISGFYFVEYVCFIEFEKLAVVFIIGNDE